MRLMLSTLTWPDGAKPEVRDIDGELVIGRGLEADWVLLDPRSQLSRRHCSVAPIGDSWRITDLSLNGTFINDAAKPLGRGGSHELHDGDRIRLGDYLFEARYQVPDSLNLGQPAARYNSPGNSALRDDGPFQDQPHGNWQETMWNLGPALKGGFTAGADAQSRAAPGAFLGGPVSDHVPSVSSAWHAPAPGRVVIPEDWDLDPALPTAGPTTAPLPLAAPLPPTHPGIVLPDDLNLELVPSGSPTDPYNAIPSAVAATAPLQVPVTAHPTPVATSSRDLLTAFLRGAGLPDLASGDPAALMESVGRALRLVVDRLRSVQMSRSAVKREFRILATLVQPEHNNPIKFSVSTEAAIRALLTADGGPERALGEVLDEIRLHELAMIAAMRDAVQDLLDALSPDHIRAATEEHGRTAMLAMQRKARAYDHYEALHARTLQALSDDFDSVFGKAFARAYERVAHADGNDPAGTAAPPRGYGSEGQKR